MNINEIYIQIAETENDSSLVELAKSEVMVIPALINLMIDNADCRAENVLIELSEQTPLLLYPYFNYIAKALDRYNNFISWNIWQIVTNLLVADYLEMWEDIKEKYFNAFKSENIAEILILISTTKTVIKYKPDCKEKLLILLEECKNNNYKICNETAPHLKTVVSNAIKEAIADL